MNKSIALLLVLAMILGCLAACGPAAPEETQGNNPPAETTEFVAPTQSTEIKEELGKLPLTEEDVTLTIGIRASANVEDYETNEYTKWLEEQTGIKLDFKVYATDAAEAATQLNLEVAGNEKLPDIIWGFTGVDAAMMYELGEDGYFVDLTNYFSESSYWFWEEMAFVDEAHQKNIFQYGTDPNNGAFYGFPRYGSGGGDSPNARPTINAQWLEAVGAEMPTNVDELYEVLKKFATEDPNGNGKADEIPMLGSSKCYRTDTVQWIINAYVFCHDEYFFNATDGKLWVPYTTDEYRQAMIYLNKLYAEGLLSPLTYTVSSNSNDYKPLITPADDVPIVGLASIHTSLHIADGSTIPAQLEAMYPLEAATELGGYAPVYGATHEYNTFITTDCENPELAFKLLDFMSGRESYLRNRFGQEGVHWDWYEGDGTTNLGVPAAITVHDSTIYSSQNNICWHDTRANITTAGRIGNYTDMSNPKDTARLFAAVYNNYVNGQRPEEVVYKIIFNSEETEYNATVESTIKDYVAEARAMFVSGVMDPSDDAAWNTYLSNLETQGLSKYIATAQGAYDRMNAG